MPPRVNGSRHGARYLYVGQCEVSGRIKVGQSISPVARLQTLRFDERAQGRVRLVGWWRVPPIYSGERYYSRDRWNARFAEIDLHARLGGSLLSGEWFHGDQNALRVLAALLPARSYPMPARVATKRAPRDPVQRRTWLTRFYASVDGGLTPTAAAAAGDLLMQQLHDLKEVKSALSAWGWAAARIGRAIERAIASEAA